MAQNLDELRAEIDRIDDSILSALSKRQEISTLIGEYKKTHAMPAIDQDRFKEMLIDRLTEGSAKGLSPELIEDIFTVIHTHSVETQEAL